jgi:hypothetical protein
MEVSGQLHAPVVYRRGERAPSTHLIGGWVGTCQSRHHSEEKKIPAPAENRNPVVQSVLSHYTGWAIPALQSVKFLLNKATDVIKSTQVSRASKTEVLKLCGDVICLAKELNFGCE